MRDVGCDMSEHISVGTAIHERGDAVAEKYDPFTTLGMQIAQYIVNLRRTICMKAKLLADESRI